MRYLGKYHKSQEKEHIAPKSVMNITRWNYAYKNRKITRSQYEYGLKLTILNLIDSYIDKGIDNYIDKNIEGNKLSRDIYLKYKP